MSVFKVILDYFDTEQKINNSPKKIICVASSRIKLNFDKYNFSRLIELNLSNSKITLEQLKKILYNSKLKKLNLKRINH